MKIHANARTCPNSRKLLVRRIEEEGSERSARKWVGRRRSGGGMRHLFTRPYRPRTNYRRRHSSLGHQPPAARLAELEQRSG